jgi:hypothetical protein
MLIGSERTHFSPCVGNSGSSRDRRLKQRHRCGVRRVCRIGEDAQDVVLGFGGSN